MSLITSIPPALFWGFALIVPFLVWMILGLDGSKGKIDKERQIWLSAGIAGALFFVGLILLSILIH